MMHAIMTGGVPIAKAKLAILMCTHKKRGRDEGVAVHLPNKRERERKNCSIVGCHCRIRNYSDVGVLCDDVKTGRAQMMG